MCAQGGERVRGAEGVRGECVGCERGVHYPFCLGRERCIRERWEGGEGEREREGAGREDQNQRQDLFSLSLSLSLCLSLSLSFLSLLLCLCH